SRIDAAAPTGAAFRAGRLNGGESKFQIPNPKSQIPNPNTYEPRRRGENVLKPPCSPCLRGLSVLGIWFLGFGFWDFPTQPIVDRDRQSPVRASRGARPRRRAAGRRAHASLPAKAWRIRPGVRFPQAWRRRVSRAARPRLPVALRSICFPILEP